MQTLQVDQANLQGLSNAEASARLISDGYNELAASKKTGIFYLLFSIFHEPIFLLLLVGAIIYFIMGKLDEAIMLSSFVLVIAGITCYQEHKTENALQALKNLASPRALVIREGIGKRIAGREVVRDDLIVVSEGDCVPADARLITSNNLLIDESILTGESLPVRKIENAALNDISRPGGNDLPFIYASTYVVQGRGVAKVYATGMNTEVGKIGKNLTGLKIERTLLQKETDNIVRLFALWGGLLCLIVAIIYGLSHADWINGLLVGIALAMAILPEEFPVVLTVFLALGAWRISKEKVLTRQVPAIETLGAATVLCVDKTGTITQNKMAVDSIFADDEVGVASAFAVNNQIPEKFHQLIEYSILANQRDPFDPTEKAIKAFGEQYLAATEHLHNDWELVRQYPLSKELLAISLVWRSLRSEQYVIAAKGAPEAIFDLCHLSKDKIEELNKQIYAMAQDGLRVLGVAKAVFKKPELPEIQHDFNFEFIGLIGLSDPVRPSVFSAVEECKQAGIRVIMITGDYPGTAQKIARQIGLDNVANVITGDELLLMSDAELQARIKTTNVFARIMPDQKLRIVNALKANKEIVAMTGDGVNDAPALKAANIGIAMGGRGTDVAREAAALVLLDDNFSSIVSAVKLGRRIFDNIKKAVVYLLAAHIPIIGLTLVPILFGWPLILMPAHIVFLELIIDPACSVVFEAEVAESDIMQRHPRSLSERLFSRKAVILGLVQGVGVLVIVLAVFFLSSKFTPEENGRRALTFAVLVLSNLALILVNRSKHLSLWQVVMRSNKAFWWVLGGALLLLGLVLCLPFLQQLFYFTSLSFMASIFCIISGFGCVIYLEIIKKIIKT